MLFTTTPKIYWSLGPIVCSREYKKFFESISIHFSCSFMQLKQQTSGHNTISLLEWARHLSASQFIYIHCWPFSGSEPGNSKQMDACKVVYQTRVSALQKKQTKWARWLPARVLTRLFPKDTVLLGGSDVPFGYLTNNVPFGSTPKPTYFLTATGT